MLTPLGPPAKLDFDPQPDLGIGVLYGWHWSGFSFFGSPDTLLPLCLTTM